jgi:hypothetical protein
LSRESPKVRTFFVVHGLLKRYNAADAIEGQAVIEVGKYSEEKFRGVCQALGIGLYGTQCANLRAKFKRVFDGKGKPGETGQVIGLINEAREAGRKAQR